jgi:alpha-tubulin suppressor-like RCC1 family protein
VSAQPVLAAPEVTRAHDAPHDRSSLAAGPAFACAIDAKGGVRCWGHNDEGQLGDGTRRTSSTAVRVKNIANATLIRASEHLSCALDAHGKLSCWGNEQEAALIAGIDDAVDVAVSYRLACVVLRSKKVECVALPNRPSENSPAQTPVVFPVSGVDDAIGIAATRAQFCVLRQAGELACFLRSGLLGDHTPTKQASPTPLATRLLGVSEVAQAAGAYDRFCATFRDGRVGCWLDASSDGSETAAPTFIAGISRATAVALGEFHGCALERGGDVLCWGSNSERELGVEEYPKGENVAVRAERVADADQITVGDGFSCVSRKLQVQCWGSAEYGALGNGKSSESDVPVAVHGIAGAVEVVAGLGFSCANEGQAGVWCWGSGHIPAAKLAEPEQLTGFGNATRITAADDSVCAYSDHGFLGCLSRSQTLYDPTATPVFPAALREARAVTGLERGAALWKNGKVTFFEPPPDTRGGIVQKPVLGLEDAIALVGTDTVACALRRAGRVSCAFSNTGHDVNPKPIKAVPITSIHDAVAITSFDAEFAVLDKSQHVTIFNYEFGNPTPVEDPFVRGVTQISIGLGFECAILGSDVVGCSGNNTHGQLGTGDLRSSTPYMLKNSQITGAIISAWGPVKDLRDATSVAAGESHACAALKDGRVFCWGSNGNQELGPSTLPYSLEPVEVIGLEGE